MHSYSLFADRIEQASSAILGDSQRGETGGAQRISAWVSEFRNQCALIEDSRGVGLPSIAVVGAKGQGKTWVARQMVLDPRVKEMLPSGVLSSEATTQIVWIGPQTPESLDPSQEMFLPCPATGLLDLKLPYYLLDTPGITDDNARAARIAKDALSLSPIKLFVVRRDQLRGAVLGSLALTTEGAICIPVITCVPPSELLQAQEIKSSSGEDHRGHPKAAASLQADLERFSRAVRAVAPSTRFLDPLLVEDFEATGLEEEAGQRLRSSLQTALASESMEQIAATKANRMEAAKERLRSKVASYVKENLHGLSQAVHTLHQEAEALPVQSLEAVLGAPEDLHAAIRGRMRAHMLSETSLLWFPYRTVLSVLSFTTGAWDRLILSFTGSVPSIFGTFMAWAKNVHTSRNIQKELHDGIRERLNRQIEDRLQPVQDAFYRTVYSLSGQRWTQRDAQSSLKVQLTGIDELQNRARSTFEWCVDRELPSRLSIQLAGLVGTVLFWLMMAGPVIAIYRKYFNASWGSIVQGKDSTTGFEFGPSVMFGSVLLSVFPLLIFTMFVLSWFQRTSKVRRVGKQTLAAEHKLLDDMRSEGMLKLRYDDVLLEHAEFLVRL